MQFALEMSKRLKRLGKLNKKFEKVISYLGAFDLSPTGLPTTTAGILLLITTVEYDLRLT